MNVRIHIGLSKGTSIAKPIKTLTLSMPFNWGPEKMLEIIEDAISDKNTDIKIDWMNENTTEGASEKVYKLAEKKAPKIKRL